METKYNNSFAEGKQLAISLKIIYEHFHKLMKILNLYKIDYHKFQYLKRLLELALDVRWNLSGSYYKKKWLKMLNF